MTQRKIAYWVIPTDADGEFVARLEKVLETAARTYCFSRFGAEAASMVFWRPQVVTRNSSLLYELRALAAPEKFRIRMTGVSLFTGKALAAPSINARVEAFHSLASSSHGPGLRDGGVGGPKVDRCEARRSGLTSILQMSLDCASAGGNVRGNSW